MEENNKAELARLEEDYAQEHARKEELDRRLKEVKTELNNIE